MDELQSLIARVEALERETAADNMAPVTFQVNPDGTIVSAQGIQIIDKNGVLMTLRPALQFTTLSVTDDGGSNPKRTVVSDTLGSTTGSTAGGWSGFIGPVQDMSLGFGLLIGNLTAPAVPGNPMGSIGSGIFWPRSFRAIGTAQGPAGSRYHVMYSLAGVVTIDPLPPAGEVIDIMVPYRGSTS